MGNPSIPHLFKPEADTAAISWSVYTLRRQGVKLDRTSAMQTRRTGLLEIGRTYAVQARLTDTHGNQLATLDYVRLYRMTKAGALLLHGVELHQTSREVSEFPQAWWCVPDARDVSPENRFSNLAA